MDQLATAMRTLRSLGITQEELGPAIAGSFTLLELESLSKIIVNSISEKRLAIIKKMIADEKLIIGNSFTYFHKKLNKGEIKYRRTCIGILKTFSGYFDNTEYAKDKVLKSNEILNDIANIIFENRYKGNFEYFYFSLRGHYGSSNIRQNSVLALQKEPEEIRLKRAAKIAEQKKEEEAKKRREEEVKRKQAEKIKEKELALLKLLKAKYEVK